MTARLNWWPPEKIINSINWLNGAGKDLQKPGLKMLRWRNYLYRNSKAFRSVAIKSLNMKKIFFVSCCIISLSAKSQGDPKLTEVWQPEPRTISPGSTSLNAPSDA